MRPSSHAWSTTRGTSSSEDGRSSRPGIVCCRRMGGLRNAGLRRQDRLVQLSAACPTPPRLPMPTRAEKATASTRWRVFWPVGLATTKKAKALSDTLAHTSSRLNKVQVSDKGTSFF